MGVLMGGFITGVVVALILCVWRCYEIVPRRPRRVKRPKDSATCSLAVFLGSGGHTAEALALLDALDFSQYTPRRYIVCDGDTLSETKALNLERQKNADPTDHTVHWLPRARRVHQSLPKATLSALRSLWACMSLVTFPSLNPKSLPFSEVLIMNGPGTCVILCMAVYINKFLGRPAPKLIYVESFARVESLSLTGKLLQYLVDRFVVQWPQLAVGNPRIENHNWLV